MSDKVDLSSTRVATSLNTCKYDYTTFHFLAMQKERAPQLLSPTTPNGQVKKCDGSLFERWLRGGVAKLFTNMLFS